MQQAVFLFYCLEMDKNSGYTRYIYKFNLLTEFFTDEVTVNFHDSTNVMNS